MATAYQIELTRRAARDLGKIQRGNPKLFQQIMDTIQALGNDPYPEGCVDLGGREGYRVRVRDHRILYSVLEAHLVVEVIRVGPRGDVYK
ncbi:type II toxin-antitoxin system RelE/ParE family toxin [Corynebacterium hylobatis]|uniref:Type II toxin-antitoxin system RelE/ParE family toxin n=2 Tax=Corynebacterium hylobatis TaxID=1859290 RepID=A0A430HUE2_9CORY|nr:type II toxin-antitoxin system RelE/ParE family toxin [Corynebacterium hylobatis]